MLPEVKDGHGGRAIQTLQMVDIATGWVELVAVLGGSYLVMQDAFLFILGPGGATAKGVSAKLGEFSGNFSLNRPIFPFPFALWPKCQIGPFWPKLALKRGD
jgi:hypothetical protein